MAKKQGVNYGPNQALIQGAATAYRNYDNMPGMYAGLDKVTKAGTDMMDEAVKGYEAEQARIKKEEEEATAEKKRQDGEWYDVTGQVYENAGSFMKDIEFKDVTNQITALKPRFIAAKESGNPEEMAAVMIEFNNIKNSVDDHKAFRADVSNPEFGVSNAMKHSGIEPGDNGEDHEFLTGLLKEDYKIIRRDGQTYYNVGGVEKTMKDIKAMTIYRDQLPYNAAADALNTFGDAKSYNRASGEHHIRTKVLPKDTKGMRAFMADDGFGNGETFLELLNKPLSKENEAAGLKSNREVIEKELLSGIFNTDSDKDSISDDEWNNFTNAIVDPKNAFWKGNEQAWEKTSRIIATEQLANGIDNRRATNPNLKKETDYNELLRKAKYDDYIKNRDNPFANYENRTVEFELFTKLDGEDVSEKRKTTSDELINLDNQLSDLMGQSSFETENYVDVFGVRVGYFPGKGFAPVKIAKEGDAGGSRKAKGGEVLRPQIKSTKAPEGGYWKTPTDVFKNYSIPTTYSGLTSKNDVDKYYNMLNTEK